MNWEGITGIAGVLIAVGSLLTSYIKSTHETTNLDAQASEAFARAAKSASDDWQDAREQIAKLWSEISKLQEEITALRSENVLLQAEVKILRDELKRYKAYSGKLYNQVIELKGTPSEMENVK